MIQPESESAFRVATMDAGEKLLSRNRAVERLAWGEAIVASFTRWLCIFFAKISEQSHAPTFAGLRVMPHLAQLLSCDSCFAFAFFLDEMELLGDIARAEKQNAFAGQPVTTSTAGLLHHKANIWFIDSHSKRDGCRHHANIIAQERFLIFCALRTR